jgi:hypothetical protein
MERLHEAALHARLRALSAQYMPDRSTGGAHIYWAPPSRKWIKVYRSAPGVVTLEYHATCPCSKVP